MVKAEVGGHLAYGAGAPDGNYIAFLDASVNDGIPGCADDVGEIEALGLLVTRFQERGWGMHLSHLGRCPVALKD
jgi:hypothetical protein